jgi:hypothetical protein
MLCLSSNEWDVSELRHARSVGGGAKEYNVHCSPMQPSNSFEKVPPPGGADHFETQLTAVFQDCFVHVLSDLTITTHQPQLEHVLRDPGDIDTSCLRVCTNLNGPADRPPQKSKGEGHTKVARIPGRERGEYLSRSRGPPRRSTSANELLEFRQPGR